ncbi:NDP-sugar epimerase, includes UDP-GlcNAc-inverting 4,6-dehydratase FlaA1 and capsular polysaccharide biosynthesis protein EpsC [Halopseudomonas xinjiangensis]|uniref:NDP-sugar epimerase, includes UDP-GlcNAc-inverting 4,6-dehydratase FlaA1 and capsular polysaccharide biosynthesis protein EpsC n=1 Tax=Halopseudomonas xinjiangensis TaxID=487184 RepID=A0A1H1NPU8_9GAMM|nr:nucleoside-diphosphate sugar epimerase/dehydratase [Halopseudomonas xinjiangensis]SDS00830.1 NDP-sugar epimerase, includes UDP-GlcNAc-inverting 4,6-dehydratase FlaA1 and capsular polysaccharide biosynthesis protein EpsC [Halopseudomonas xinjiangensis]
MIRERLANLSYSQKRSIQIVLDVLLLWLALWTAFYLRLGTEEGWLWPEHGQGWIFILAPILAIPFYIRLGMYRAVLRYFGNDALKCIAKAVTLGFVALAATMYILREVGMEVLLSRSVFFMYWCLSLCLLGGLRLAVREYFLGDWFTAGNPFEKSLVDRDVGRPVAIYGAGGAGNELVASLKISRMYKPVAFIDENPYLHGRTVQGLPVYSSEQIGEMIQDTGVRDLFLAIPSASRSRRREVLTTLEQYPLHVRSMPGIMDLVTGKVKVDDLQEVDIADLLGRDAVPPDPSLFARCITGKTVMVTGAGGSIGSELCRQIVSSLPSRLVLFEHSEYALYKIHAELKHWLGNRLGNVVIVPILGSIRNEARLEQVIERWEVETIYHAAAYKHVPIVEHNVSEGVMNNVFGTLNVAQAAIRCQVESVVLVSTDKAVRPTNVMGSTKRLAEMVLQALNTEQAPRLWGKSSSVNHLNRTRFEMVRFGNVLDSSGSVIPLFREQIQQGGPVTVTHPDITRYFMTIPEAAQLVIQAGAMGQGGDVFVLDMGEPVRILDLARKMVLLSGLSVRDESSPKGDIEIVFTGLRPGEKLYEELLIGDNPEPTIHSKIRRANEAHLSWDRLLGVLDELESAVRQEDPQRVREMLLATVQGYTPGVDIVDLLYDERFRKDGA